MAVEELLVELAHARTSRRVVAIAAPEDVGRARRAGHQYQLGVGVADQVAARQARFTAAIATSRMSARARWT
jgi:hypothetical protein